MYTYAIRAELHEEYDSYEFFDLQDEDKLWTALNSATVTLPEPVQSGDLIDMSLLVAENPERQSLIDGARINYNLFVYRKEFVRPDLTTVYCVIAHDDDRRALWQDFNKGTLTIR